MQTDQLNPIAYCGVPPTPATLMGAWNLDPVLLVALGLWAAALYRHGKDAFGWSAWALAVVVFVSPLCNLTSALFSARVVHHVLLSAVIVPLALLGLAPALRDRMRIVGVGAAILLHAGAMWAWHAPGPYAWALATTPGYWLMQATLAGSAAAVWLHILSPDRGAAAVAAGGTFVQMGMLGAIILFAGQPLYGAHLLTTEAWGLSPLADQQFAGLLMWVVGALPYMAALLWQVARLADEAAPEPAKAPR
ncbi:MULTISPECIES: cytochrome c oxidase assembly protein [unclassified Paracoccus (in: a-proteobacteria)]|uniref:cytochrome c oxidase assembly protein n=1 Tax=unclassified Paracoccus (in: a-proteobacteria) TaxID=2688777 RepID=UPI001600A8BD|nr:MULTISPECIES: cytochrome c oxidase assembly protein [unclassified Paracoccus (in: a-proteobacteria)]MBB1490921.1 cytochrome c oxidase assembly protein [Paracoccus sp. MC1854]MBB1497735.1 cytochrome c oxidase assembly protein [Paracoccus sp. MC1862]QQO45225.1 cytochrome c oxidase assembly protein [Paracoccus sp. MC1862]